MIPYELQNISLLSIQVFLQCAKRLNFRQAAGDLKVTPGMISKKITALEQALGFELFNRESNHVTLTDAGAQLYAAWDPLMETLVLNVDMIRKSAHDKKVLSFEFFTGTNLERYFVPLLNSLPVEASVNFRMKLTECSELPENLLSGETDIAFVPLYFEPYIRKYAALAYFLAVPSPLYVAMSDENPLVNRDILQVEDLKDSSIILPETDVTGYREMVMALLAASAIESRIKSVPAFGKFQYLTLSGRDVFLTDKYYHAFRSHAVEFRELAGTRSGLLMVWKKTTDPYMMDFLAYAEQFYKELK